ncbi:MAG: VOC family protein [Gammaproteobacteria bacterium]|nr:VOC family protein [Gammaproteobacteria bacterium]
MELGGFSVSLNVADIHASDAFYKKLGFTVFHGDKTQGWLIMKNGKTNIGLIQGMFDKNILTFNTGWDQDATETETFTDVRELQTQLTEQGVELTTKADLNSNGPASIAMVDPDGNPILIDQHR